MRSNEEDVNQSTGLKQLLYAGAENYTLELLKRGRISIGEAAELLDKIIQDIYRLAKGRNIELGVTETHYKESKETVNELIK